MTNRIIFTTTNVVDGMIQNAALSDLFFNYDHPAYDRLVRDDAGAIKPGDPVSTDEEREAALRKDAEDFAGTLASATGIQLDADGLVADFFERL